MGSIKKTNNTVDIIYFLTRLLSHILRLMNKKPIKTLMIDNNNTNKYIVGKSNEESFINK